MLALVGIWNRDFCRRIRTVLPYDEHLASFAYLQQLEMEKRQSVRRGGEPVECATCPVIWES
jgi:glucose-6-phosphate isomerase